MNTVYCVFLWAKGRGQQRRMGKRRRGSRGEQVMDLCSRETREREEVGGGAQEARSGPLSQREEQVSSQWERGECGREGRGQKGVGSTCQFGSN